MAAVFQLITVESGEWAIIPTNEGHGRPAGQLAEVLGTMNPEVLGEELGVGTVGLLWGSGRHSRDVRAHGRQDSRPDAAVRP